MSQGGEIFGSICCGFCSVFCEGILYQFSTVTKGCYDPNSDTCCKKWCTCGFGEGEIEERDEDEIHQPFSAYEKTNTMILPPQPQNEQQSSGEQPVQDFQNQQGTGEVPTVVEPTTVRNYEDAQKIPPTYME